MVIGTKVDVILAMGIIVVIIGDVISIIGVVVK